MSFRVAYILSSTLPNGGATKAFLSLLDGVMPLGVEPLVIVPDTQGIYPTLQQRGIPVFAINYRMETYPRFNTLKQKVLFLPRLVARLVLNRMATEKVKRLLTVYGIQLVHTNVSVVGIGRKAAHSLGIPHIYHFREYADLDFGFHYFPTKAAFYRSISSAGDYSICITRKIREHHLLAADNRVRVIYDGVRPQQQSFPCLPKQPYILYAGRVQATKGLTDLLDAYSLAVAASSSQVLDLKIAGSCPDAAYLSQARHIISCNHLGNKVEFLGECGNIDLLMQQARAIVVPSRFEGFGLCMPEAMFNGCIAVGYSNAGTQEQFENGRMLNHGDDIGLPYHTSQELTDIILKLSSTPVAEFDDMRQRAFRVVNQLYTVEKNASDVYAFYQQILS